MQRYEIWFEPEGHGRRGYLIYFADGANLDKYAARHFPGLGEGRLIDV